MYGTQDASKIFQEDDQEWLKQNGGTFCQLCPARFRFKERGLLGLVHGDDFLVVGEDAQLRWLDGVLNKKYTAKGENLVGDGPGDKRSMTFLNRLVKYIPDGADEDGRRLEIEADARHAEILLREFGFNFNQSMKGCDVPEDKTTQADLVEADRQSVLESKQVRSMVMRMAYMSVDRPDLCHVVRSFASAMKGPKMIDWRRLKKAVSQVLGERALPQEDLPRAAHRAVQRGGALRISQTQTGQVISGVGGRPRSGDQGWRAHHFGERGFTKDSRPLQL